MARKKMTTVAPEDLLTKLDADVQARVEKLKTLQDGMQYEPTAFSVTERAVDVDDALEATLNDLNNLHARCMARVEKDHGNQLTINRFKALQNLAKGILDRAHVDAYNGAEALRRQQAACYAKAWADEHDVHRLASEVNQLKPGVAKPVFNVLTAKAVELVDADKCGGKERLYRLGEQLEALTPVVFACVVSALRADEVDESRPKRGRRRG